MARVRLSVEERREDLLRAAIEQIQTRGVAAVRIADVAAVLGVSNALVLYHFSTKEKLLAAAFRYAAEEDLAQLRELLGRRTSALRRLHAATRWYAPTGEAKGWRLWIEGWAAAPREPALHEVASELDQQWKSALAAVITEGVDAGEFRCADPVATAWRLTALLDGLAVQMTSYAGSLTRTTLLEWSDEALARELGVDRAVLTAGGPS
ncbi:TetR family transcriptional regulator C-terminal domain-containing protein [Streptomyces sp. IB2014 016-6]|uniref:TetR/AcrR family transcriptional regulator n=1 Tax=Streptomyces sp. IB2014 016-6 TaxID=2517818 RepID=UPI0011CC7DA1|nr:TetR family transcriptional regulator C-terminal domain-containing protein [Streptomyces sp. IB2014 016-6]TXL87502.1 TetR family transcriptional regulator [Streptomyces sp. IB2014 016-6]